MNIQKLVLTLILLLGLSSCFDRKTQASRDEYVFDSIALPSIDSLEIDTLEIDSLPIDSLAIEQEPIITDEPIVLSEELLYDRHTLEDEYTHKGEERRFQWEKIKEYLALVEALQKDTSTLGVLQNYRNRNGLPPLPEKHGKNNYQSSTDSLGTERSQAIPLFKIGAEQPSIYARDGSLVQITARDTLSRVQIAGISFEGEWEVPEAYVASLGDSLYIRHIAFVDVRYQNICLIEQTDEGWKIRSKNPATTGVNKPPYSRVTPTGIFVLQGKRTKMYYLKDGTHKIEGFAPFASRFTNGAYIHGVPVNKPNGEIIEYSPTLGTTPRSHMCVRTASSHAEFIHQQTKSYESLVIVID